MRTKVVICGPHQSICGLLALKLRSLAFVDVVAKYRDTKAALRDARDLLPDIVILDTELPPRAFKETLAAFHHTVPGSKIILFTSASRKQDHLTSFLPQIVHVASKHDHIGELLEMIRQASGGAGESRLDAPGSSGHPGPHDHDDDENDDILGTLTDKETRILTLIAMSNSTKQVASLLGISAHTVSNFRARIMCKISAKDQAALVRYALVNGLIEA